MAPANDAFAAAVDLGSAAAGHVAGSNVGATTEVGEPAASDSGQPNPSATVWWKWTCPASAEYASFSTATTTFDTVIGIYTGAAVGALTEITSNDDTDVGTGGTTSHVTFVPTPSTTYYIQVDGFSGGDEGDIVLSWQAGSIPTPAVSTAHGTGTDAVTFSVGSTGRRGCAVAVLGGTFSRTAGELGGFTVSPSGNWAKRETITDDIGQKIGELWTITFDDDGVPAADLTPTFTAVDGAANPITPGTAKIAYAWTTISYADSVNWLATNSSSGEQDAPSAVQVVDPDLVIGSFLQTASHYVGAASLLTTTVDGSSNPIILSAAADAPLSHSAQATTSGPISDAGAHDIQTLIAIASDINITPVAGMSGTRTWTTTWTDAPPPYDNDAGLSGAGIIIRAYPSIVPSLHVCPFHYPYYWPSIYQPLLSGDPAERRSALQWLTIRDDSLAQHLEIELGSFFYPYDWADLSSRFGEDSVLECLEDNDRVLEDSLCNFTYPWRWAQLWPDLASGNPAAVARAVGLLEDRDRALEDYLVVECGGC